jgi:hypothetical protein
MHAVGIVPALHKHQITAVNWFCVHQHATEARHSTRHPALTAAPHAAESGGACYGQRWHAGIAAGGGDEPAPGSDRRPFQTQALEGGPA